MNNELQDLYNNRFSDFEKKKKNGLWIEICKFIEGRYSSEFSDGIVVDVAAGYCDFINEIGNSASLKKYAIDLNPDVKKYAADDVITLCESIDNLKYHFKSDSVSLFFMSNFLEHISKEQIHKLLVDEYDLLKPGGAILILTPNIKYVGGKYWDFFDHITPITDVCLIEEAETIGFSLSDNIKRFLPFTTKSRLPQAQWIVSLYLKLMPLSGFLFGEQSLLLFRK